MIPRITTVNALPNYRLRVVFDDGKMVIYDVMEDIRQIESYRALLSVQGLFEQLHLDTSRTCVCWTDEIDLPSDTLYQYGQAVM